MSVVRLTEDFPLRALRGWDQGIVAKSRNLSDAWYLLCIYTLKKNPDT